MLRFGRGTINGLQKENNIVEIKRFIGGILEANCYVVSPSRPGADAKAPCFIIDPGYDAPKIMKYIKAGAFAPEGIILTHHHSDHSGAAARLRKELDCPVMIHREDADRFREGADRLLEEADVLSLGGGSKSNGGSVKLTVLHTPGHTRGGICLLSEKDKVCFTGDTIFNVDLGRTDLNDGSYEEMVRSITEVCDKWGNDLTIYPGHGDPATMKTVRKINLEFLEIVNGN